MFILIFLLVLAGLILLEWKVRWVWVRVLAVLGLLYGATVLGVYLGAALERMNNYANNERPLRHLFYDWSELAKAGKAQALSDEIVWTNTRLCSSGSQKEIWGDISCALETRRTQMQPASSPAQAPVGSGAIP